MTVYILISRERAVDFSTFVVVYLYFILSSPIPCFRYFFLLFFIPFYSSFLIFDSHAHLFSYSILSCRADYQYNPRGSSASVKKRILITHNLRLLKIKTKDYGKGQTLHNFMLEEVIIFILVFALIPLFLIH